MPVGMKSAYVLKVESKFNGAELKKKIEDKILDNIINDAAPKRNKKGFVNKVQNNGNEGVEKKYFIYPIPTKLSATYVEYKEIVVPYDNETIFIPAEVQLLYDISKRTIIVLSSHLGYANKLLKLLGNSDQAIIFRRPRYINNEDFFRWIINNEKNHREKLPSPCKLKNIDFAKIKDLEGSDEYPTTKNIGVESADHLCDDLAYEEFKDVGRRECIKGDLEHSKWRYVIKMYQNGKITLSGFPPDVDSYSLLGIFSVAFEELENIYQAFLEDTGQV